MQRRDFIKLSAAAGAVGCISACGKKSDSTQALAPAPVALSEEKLNWTACLVNCGSNCPLKVYSRDGIATRVETDWSETDEYGNHQVRACLRGRSLRQRNYAPDRIKQPLKRVAGTKRGDGQWEEISWEQAFNEIGGKVAQLKQDFGPTSIYHHYVSGAYYSFASGNCIRRALVNAGAKEHKGYMSYYSNYSWAALNVAGPATFATGGTGGTRFSHVEDSDFFLGFGFNPFEIRMSGAGEQHDFHEAIQRRRAAGKKFAAVLIDPRYTDSALGKEDKWLPIRPGTDAAMAAAVAYEMMKGGKDSWVENNSRAFLDKHTVGYDAASIMAAITANPALVPAGMSATEMVKNNYHDYILGLGEFAADGARTPQWAEKICGIPAAEISKVAQQLMDSSNPYISIGAGPNRHANGEQNMRSMYMLSILAGKLGQAGTNTGELPTNFRHRSTGLGDGNPITTKVCFFDWLEAVERGDQMSFRSHAVKGLGDDIDATLPTKVKAVFCSGGNGLINQHADINKTRKVLERVGQTPEGHGPELIVVTDCWMTSSAKMADYVLPDSSWLESNDIADDSYASGETGYQTYMSTSLKPFFGATLSMYEIGLGIVKASGGDVEGYTEGRANAQEWLDHLYESTRTNAANAPLNLPKTYTEAQKIGFFRSFAPDRGPIAMDGLVNKGQAINTPTGKIEIFSFDWAKQKTMRTAFVADDRDSATAVDHIDPTPKYVKTWEGYESDGTKQGDGERDAFPLQVVGYHTKGRAHSSYHNVKWLRDAVEDAVWVHPIDAKEYGIENEKEIIMESARGKIQLRARVTPRVAPGCVAIGEGAWYDAAGVGEVDKGGCSNTLTKYHPGAVGRGNTQHTIRVKLTNVAG
ncbi:DMSO/selenate family reductase complex A subunit [Ferrimonas lipolytica]|uniref:Molybdopterin-dependent oxidoreductase n=1 Tax=Ferrimonas lipolytica TaxID=2724191 RepID=A0A6H1UG08_9GAMM|nr:DMSO/selenate family reductase complex A subunit [Ferrimonas lipolytica]QIZ78037.1 molybdopterin-dependent oxidoreductase [Ferrimonas lipolytica]